MTVMAGVAAMLPPQVRIRGRSMEEPHGGVYIGSSGTAVGAASALINGPMAAHCLYRWMERTGPTKPQACR